jgi:hypothetical protein
VVLAWVQLADQLLEAGFERDEPLLDFLSLRYLGHPGSSY